MRENTRVCKYGACAFCLRKNGCSILSGLLQLFAVPSACAPCTIAPMVTARKPTEYCFLVQ